MAFSIYTQRLCAGPQMEEAVQKVEPEKLNIFFPLIFGKDCRLDG